VTRGTRKEILADKQFFRTAGTPRRKIMIYDVVTHPLAHPIISVLAIIVAGGAIWFWMRKV